MKTSPDFIKTSTLIKITLLSFSLIFLRKLFTNSYQQQPPQLHHSSPPFATPPPASVERTGIVDDNGIMTADFIVGEFDPTVIGGVANASEEVVVAKRKKRARVKVGVCDENMIDYVPCFDNVETKANSTAVEEKYKRRCPEEGKELNCLVPKPKGYKQKIPWPRSRDEVWFGNIPNPRPFGGKGGETWISRKNDKFVFPGEGTKFVHGADQYIDQISEMVPEIAFGRQTQTALDIGCGVAGFGAFLLERNVSTLSIAPKDDDGNWIQFALERGVPAMIAAFATNRLPYPSQAFDLIHCSSCNISWTLNGGIMLLEVNRMLRAGGYFIWAARPGYKNEGNLDEQWQKMDDLARLICWGLVKKEGHIAVWRKPLNNSCYLDRQPEAQPPLCEVNDDPDDVWNVSLKTCISRLPEPGYGVNITTWPARLHSLPDRMLTINMDAYMSRKDILRADSKYWKVIVDCYIRTFRWKELNLRNVMDMRARYGGFAAAVHDYGIDCWVMNVVPVSSFNTLPVIYDRGLTGVMHDWCEPFDTYPRTYDLLNAAGLFSTEQLRCNISSIMLEMDRILRPGGRVYILDAVTVIEEELKDIAESMGWSTRLFESIEGPHASWKLLFGKKRL